MSNSKEFVFNVRPADGSDTCTIRMGTAAPIYDPETVNVSGAITAPQEFLTGKRFNIDKEAIVNVAELPESVIGNPAGIESGVYYPYQASVYVDKEKLTLTLKLNEKDKFKDIIEGKLEISKELATLSINSDSKKYTVDELKRLIKLHRYMFASALEQSQLLLGLEKFNAKVTTNIAQESSNRGNRLDMLERTVSDVNLPTQFVLAIPVFKGGPKYTFTVELAIDSTDGGVRFFLDSPELIDLQARVTEEVFNEQIDYFNNWGCSVVTIS